MDHTGVQRLGLIVLRANDLPQAQAILDRDPFTQAGVTVPAVYEWLRLDPRILPYLKGGSGTDGGNGGGNQGVPPVRPGPRIDTLPQTSPLVQKLIKTSSGPRFVALTIPKDRSKMEKVRKRENQCQVPGGGLHCSKSGFGQANAAICRCVFSPFRFSTLCPFFPSPIPLP